MLGNAIKPVSPKFRKTRRKIRLVYRACVVAIGVLACLGYHSFSSRSNAGERDYSLGRVAPQTLEFDDDLYFQGRSLMQNDEETEMMADRSCAFNDSIKAMGKQKKCDFITGDGKEVCKPDGFVNYSEFYFCDGIPSALVIIILIVLMLYFFFLIGEVAEDFFAPTMASISEVLHLPHNVAGVTFLAIGNGAPDLFSGFVAITGNSPGLGLAALLGAGVFVSAVVVGGCCLVAPNAKLTRRPMIRDNLFLLGTVIYVLVLISTHTIVLVEAIILLLTYVFYIGVVIFGRIIYLRTKNAKAKAAVSSNTAYNQMDEDDEDEDEDTQFPPNYKSSYQSHRSWARTLSKSKTSRAQTWANRHGAGSGIDRTSVDLARTSQDVKPSKFVSESALSKASVDARRPNKRESEMETFATNGAGPNTETLLQEDASDVGSDDSDEEDTWFDKALEIIGFPFHVAWVITVPLITSDDWNSELKDMDQYAKYARYLVIFQAVAAPTFALWGVGVIASEIGGFPISIIFIAAGAALGVATWYVTRKDPEQPRFVAIYLILAFIAGAVWVLLLANELVSLLTALGLASGIDQVVLGLTLLAWGNAVPDTIANTTVAKQGYPQMALGAAFGEPLGNHLLGLGIALIVNTSRDGSFDLPHDGNIVICAVFEIAVLISHIITFPFITKFRLKKPYAFWLFGLYGAFIVVSILQAVGLIDFGL